MILHERTLILDPDVFGGTESGGGLTPEKLKELEAMGVGKAIEVLKGVLVRVLKERRRGKGKGVGKGQGGASARGGKAGAGRGGGNGKKTATATPAATGPLIPVLITQAPVGDAESPIVVVDSDDDDGGHVMKKPRVGPALPSTTTTTALPIATIPR